MNFPDDFAAMLAKELSNPDSVVCVLRHYIQECHANNIPGALTAGDTNFIKGKVEAYKQIVDFINNTAASVDTEKQPDGEKA